MTYRVVFAVGAASQYHDLPAGGQAALLQRAVELARAPWDATVLPPGDVAAFREAVFGEGRGLVDFYVDDDSQTLRIFNLVWIG